MPTPYQIGQTTGTQQGDINAGYIVNGSYITPGTIPVPVSSISPVVNNGNNNSGVVGSSSGVANTVNNTQNGLANLTANDPYKELYDRIMNPQVEPQNLINQRNDIQTQGQNLGTLTPEQENQIAAAGGRAGTIYDPLIEQAQLQKKRGMPKAIVGVGESGGFMSTQFAGRAALQPTEGGDFVGAGGELSALQSEYDLNISDLQARKNAAIQAAQESYRQYIRTGKQQDLDNSVKNYQLAEDAYKNQNDVANQKMNATLQWIQINQEMNKPILQANEKIQDFAIASISKYPSGFSDLSSSDLTKLTLSDIQSRILNSDEYKTELEKAQKGAETSTITEYEYAKKQGYKGTLLQYKQEQANLKAIVSFNPNDILTPTEAAALNVPYGTTKGEAFGKTPVKPTTQVEQQAKGYYDRTVEADKVITDLGDKFTGLWSYVSQYAPNIWKSEDRQKVEQAERNFVNAVLRRESGAAIAESEFNSAAEQYFPQPGDSQAVLKQKQENRQLTMNALLQQSGANNQGAGNTEDFRTKYNY